MIQEITKNGWTKFISGILIGGAIIYFAAYTKTYIKDTLIKELTTKNSQLELTIASNTKIDEVTVKEGERTTTKKHTEIVSNLKAKEQTQEVSKVDANIHEKTDINKKFLSLIGLIDTKPIDGIVGYEVLVKANITNSLGIVAGVEYNTLHKETTGKIGASVDIF